MVRKRHVPSRKRMWLAWGIVALGVASCAAQDSSPAQAEPSHDSSVTVRRSLLSGMHLLKFVLPRQSSLSVIGSLPSGSHTHKVTRPYKHASLSVRVPNRQWTRRAVRRVACNPNLILCLVVTSRNHAYRLSLRYRALHPKLIQ
jgi:hypothetical protein